MTYRSKVATVFLLGFFLDLINMFIASVAFPAMGQPGSVSDGARGGSFCFLWACSAPGRWLPEWRIH